MSVGSRCWHPTRRLLSLGPPPVEKLRSRVVLGGLRISLVRVTSCPRVLSDVSPPGRDGTEGTVAAAVCDLD